MLLSDSVSFFLQEFKNNSDLTSINIEVTLTKENMKLALLQGIIKTFKLSKAISTSNMNLLRSDCLIKTYTTPEQSKKRTFYH